MLSWDDFNQEDTATTGAAVAPPPPPPVEASETPAPAQLPLESSPEVNDASGSQGFAPQAEAPESTSNEDALQKAIDDLSSLDVSAGVEELVEAVRLRRLPADLVPDDPHEAHEALHVAGRVEPARFAVAVDVVEPGGGGGGEE